MTGYEALREAAAWVDVSDRGKIRMAGEDRVRLLHAMTTNSIEALKPGDSCYAFFLSAQGRILADVNVFCFEDSLLLDTEPETRTKIYEHLDRFIIADDVTLEDETDSTATIALAGPQAGFVSQKVDVKAWPVGIGFVLLAPASEKAALEAKLSAAGAVEASGEALELVELERGKPRYGADLTERFLAQEANQPQALNFSKGCYLGQEIVERVRSRGAVHRLLMPLEIEGSDVPDPGTKITEGAGSVAEITSAAFSPALGKVVALGYVRSDKAVPGTEFPFEGTVVRVRKPDTRP